MRKMFNPQKIIEGVNFMLQISRKYFALQLNHVYFQELKDDSRFDPKLIRYTHLLKPSRQLQGQKTVHIDLQKDEQRLLNSMSTDIQNEVQDMQEKNWNISIIDNVKDSDIHDFKQFYNLNRKKEGGRKINNFDIQTLKLLRDKGGLHITKLENERNETICYRVYVINGEMAMSLYDCSQARRTDDYANAFLIWENIKHFRRLGYKVFDFGDIKGEKQLQQLKVNYGGTIVTVFSGFISKTFISAMLLQLHWWLGMKGTSYE